MADVSESYRVICSGLVCALRKLGAPGEFIPVNDVAVYGKKISGNAQTRRAGFLLQHGTLMYATDLDTVEKALLAPREKLESKGVRSIRERVITLREVIGEVDVNALVESLIEGFSRALSAEVYHDVLSEEELKATDNLVAKYRSPEWIFKRRPR